MYARVLLFEFDRTDIDLDHDKHELEIIFHYENMIMTNLFYMPVVHCGPITNILLSFIILLCTMHNVQ